jgi:diamine N-acetyltransferase
MAVGSPSSPPEPGLPGRGSSVSLVEITRDNLRDYLRLKVRPDQEGFVAPNAVSIAQAYFHPEAWFRGIAAGGEPVGFAMLEDWTARREEAPAEFRAEPYIALWRFMIDARYQAHGFGAVALRQLIAHARSRLPGGVMFTSYVPGEGCPGPFYHQLGFRETGKLDGIERVLRLPLE